MNVAYYYEAPMQMLTTEKYIAARPASWLQDSPIRGGHYTIINKPPIGLGPYM